MYIIVQDQNGQNIKKEESEDKESGKTHLSHENKEKLHFVFHKFKVK